MKPRPAGRRAQRGAALILMASLLILGVTWGALAALNRASSAVTRNDREVVTGDTLYAAKQALLGYVAQYAANAADNPNFPGRLPCPESLSAIDTVNEGEASSACSNVTAPVGRLPWKTLGIEPLRDGDGERLWYVLSPNFHPVTTPPTTPLNFGTAAALPFDGSNVVALIIAPGKAMNTLSNPATPTAPCTKVQQTQNRYVAPLDPAKFLECGNATGAYANLGASDWTNDRVIAITKAEWIAAIAGPVADRLQRQVAPAMNDYRSTTSLAVWGERFFPNASSISATITGSQPETNDLCGDNDTWSGMPPTATVASGACSTNWATYSISGLGALLGGGTCAAWPAGTPTEVRCDFTMLLGGIASPRINITAPRIGYSFRTIDTSQITIQANNFPALPPYPAATIGSFASSVSSTSGGDGTLSFQVFFPFLTLGSTVRIRIPYPSDALVADARSAWYVNNGWDHYTYYGVSQAASSDPGATVCNPGGTVTNCMTVNGMPSPSNDKRLVLVLMGPQLPGTTQPSYTVSNYWEGQNGSVGVIYEVNTINTTTFNDRVAACPYRYYDTDGVTILGNPC